MKSTLPRLLLPAALLLAGLIPSAVAADPAARSATEDRAAAVRSARLAQNTAIVAHDLDRIASFWTDNVTICRGLGMQVAGKEGYLQLFREDGPGNVVYQRHPDEVAVSPDWPLAFETGHWEGRQNGQVVIAGRYSAQWVRRGDRWLIRGEVYVALEAQGAGRQMQAAP
jgi:ketosteroid isomerase-like protein